MNPSERERAFGASGSTEGGAGGEGPKRQDQVVKFSSGAKGQFPSGSAETGGEMKKFANRNRTPDKTFNQFKNEVPISPTEVVTGPTKVDGKIDTSKPKKEKVKITRGRARKDKGLAPRPEPPVKIEKKPSAFAKAVQKADKFVQKNPVIGGVSGLAAYDLGKGVLGIILNIRSLGPGVVGGTVGRRSARGGGGL